MRAPVDSESDLIELRSSHVNVIVCVCTVFVCRFDVIERAEDQLNLNSSAISRTLTDQYYQDGAWIESL